MEWQVEYNDEFEDWCNGLTVSQHEYIAASVELPELQRWYDEYVPVADRLYDEHIQIMKNEKLLENDDG